MQYEYTHSRVSFAYRKMKFLALCLLLATGSCLAGVASSNTYSAFYNSLPDECKCVTIRPADGRVYGVLCQYSVDRWQTIKSRGGRVKESVFLNSRAAFQFVKYVCGSDYICVGYVTYLHKAVLIHSNIDVYLSFMLLYMFIYRTCINNSHRRWRWWCSSCASSAYCRIPSAILWPMSRSPARLLLKNLSLPTLLLTECFKIL
jgi:hypothetical protein